MAIGKKTQSNAKKRGLESFGTLRQKAKNVVKEASSKPRSIFDSWASQSLNNLLIHHNVQVRGLNQASHKTLVKICDELFGPGCSLVEKDFIRSYTSEEMERLEQAARIIQQAYIDYRQRIYYSSFSNIVINVADIQTNSHNEEQPSLGEYGSEEGDLEGCRNTEDDDNDEAADSKLESPQEHCGNDGEANPIASSPSILGLEVESTKKLDEELDIEWIKPSWRAAKKFEAVNRPHRSGTSMKMYNWKFVTLGRHCTVGGCGEQLDLWDEGQMSEFAQFGSGITNYFKFLKWCCWIMFILSIIHVPAIIINIFGASMQYESLLALTTLGNIGSAKEVEYVSIPACDGDKYQFEVSCILDKDRLALFYSLLDALGTITVIVGFYWLRRFEKNEVDHLNRSTVDASDYTLRVSGIPHTVTERGLAAHFAGITGEAVAEVNIAFANSKEINRYMTRGKVMKQRIDCIQRIRYELSIGRHINGGKSSSKRRMKKLLKERKNLTALMDLRDAQTSAKIDPNPDAIQAFVTFETEQGFVKAISAYQMNWLRASDCFYPKHLRLSGKKLRVSQAPEPSTIIWENIEVQELSRFGRKCLTTFIASLAILFSIYFTFLARDFKIKTLESMRGVCPDFFVNLNEEEQLQEVEQDIGLSHCFCENLDSQTQLNTDLCRDFVHLKIKATAMSYSAGIWVAFMNTFFTILMDRAGSFEKHQSLDDMESSNMTRVFILKFLNTGCLVLLYNQKMIQKIVNVNFVDTVNFDIDWYETGGVTMMIVMTINIFSPHIGSLIAYARYRSKIRKLEKNLTEDGETDDKYKIWYAQEELNKLYLGPPFHLNYRYTQLLVNFYICWMYAISMPILPIIGTISFFCSYWVDKFLFCNFYSIPPKYSDAIGARSTSLIGFGIIVHIFMSCWILGRNQIFEGESFSHKASSEFVGNIRLSGMMLKKHVVILETIGFLFLSSYVARRFFVSFRSTLTKLMRCVFCGKGNEVQKLQKVMNRVQVTYSGARARGVIKGLASYNILQNPEYQLGFAITPEFAMNHKRLCAIKGYNTKEGFLCISSQGSSSSEDKV